MRNKSQRKTHKNSRKRNERLMYYPTKKHEYKNGNTCPTDAPSAPTIRGYKTGEVLVAGDERTLTCEVVGGNPRPRVAWYRHGRPLNTVHKPTKRRVSGPEHRKERVVTVNQDVTATRLEDGAVYECRVTTAILPDPISATVTLTVHCKSFLFLVFMQCAFFCALNGSVIQLLHLTCTVFFFLFSILFLSFIQFT